MSKKYRFYYSSHLSVIDTYKIEALCQTATLNPYAYQGFDWGSAMRASFLRCHISLRKENVHVINDTLALKAFPWNQYASLLFTFQGINQVIQLDLKFSRESTVYVHVFIHINICVDFGFIYTHILLSNI